MAEVPAFMLPHSVTVKPYAGTTALGPTYGPEVQVRCRVEDKRQLVRDSSGAEVVSETRLFAQPAALASFPPESEVTLPTRKTTVISVQNHDDGGMGGWQHVEVTLR